MILALALALAPLPAGTSSQQVPDAASTDELTRPNVLLLVADDVGVDLVAAYGESPTPPCTPNIDRLAATGVLFRNAWTNPVCSPTRAQILTGRHGFRTGIGRTVGDLVDGTGLDLEEDLLPEVLPGYATAAIGKWHLGDAAQGPLHPNESGFERFAGSLSNLQGSGTGYTNWTKTIDGLQVPSSVYATEDTVDEALLATSSLPEPWMILVAFNACHTPIHDPPPHLCAAPAPCADAWCGNVSPERPTPERVRAMMEVLDAQLGRLLEGIADAQRDTVVIFLGDNGTDGEAVEPPFDPLRAKGTLYQAGIRVPLIVSGPDTVVGECQALVTATDVFATVTELAGFGFGAEDSISLAPYLAEPELPSLRDYAYAEWFTPNHPSGPPEQHRRAVRDRRFKLIRRIGQVDELYDLLTDPLELVDLHPSLVPGTRLHDRYLELDARLDALGGPFTK